MSAGGSWIWMAAALGLTTGCLGELDPLPPPIGGSSEGTASSTTQSIDTADTTADGETTHGSSATGTIDECGNGLVEDGEECDGLDGVTCTSLGLGEGKLQCADCQLDTSYCGLPPGMVEVPGGEFDMGSDHPDADSDEVPIRRIQVDTFWIDQTEVTVEAYAACVADDEASCSPPGEGASCNWMVAGREQHPVNCVTWAQAEAYCAWVGGGTKRLPTEAEWEKAARGTDARTYAWGDRPTPTCSYAVMDELAAGGPGCGTNATMPVGSKPLGDSPYGLHDMAGNVGEWVADWYAPYDAAELDNPTGPATGTLRVRRGGSLDTNATYLRASNRGYATERPDPLEFLGIRCARTPPGSR